MVITALVGTLMLWVPYVYAHNDGESSQVSSVFDVDSHQHDDVDSGCDHCCHFSAHVVAIAASYKSLRGVSRSISLSKTPRQPPSYSFTPPGPPPKHFV